ncbi:MAG: hypothetical protein MUE83_17175 [Tabrizicola sp.]|jgi:hypothetical protein|nr:hypothetical protein [Tabrizicola sp.]
MSALQLMADKLADDVLAAEIELGDDRFYEKVAEILMAASPTFQEAYMTSIRVRLAERRGRDFLERALAAKRGVPVDSATPDAPEEPVEVFGSGH